MKFANKLYMGLWKRVIACDAKLRETKGQFVMDHAVVFVICLALGAIVLALLIGFVKTGLAPTLQTKIMEFFNYS